LLFIYHQKLWKLYKTIEIFQQSFGSILILFYQKLRIVLNFVVVNNNAYKDPQASFKLNVYFFICTHNPMVGHLVELGLIIIF
jgi:hypothetical protein